MLTPFVVKRKKFALQLDESTDVSGLVQLIVFVRYIANGKPEEDLLMCASLLGTRTGEDIFSAVDTRLKNDGLSWKQRISICTDELGLWQENIKVFWQEYYKLGLESTLTFALFIEKILPAKHWTQI